MPGWLERWIRRGFWFSFKIVLGGGNAGDKEQERCLDCGIIRLEHASKAHPFRNAKTWEA